MGKPTGFLEFERVNKNEACVMDRIKNFDDFHLPFDVKTQKEQASRCMNCGIPFCQSAMKYNSKNVGCPLSNLIPEWNHLIYLGLYEEAYKRLSKTAPFPEFTGRVCPALCEACCTCSIDSEAVNVRANELFLIEEAFEKGYIKPNRNIKRNGKRIAVIGSGPSGLAAAKKLNDAGFLVTVFEKNDRFGGLLMYGIPNMKIEKHIIDRRIKLLSEEGIVFVNNTFVGVDYSMDNLSKDYDHIVFACGTSKARELKIDGVNKKGIYYAVDFLSSTTKDLLDGHKFKIDLKDKNVIVLGGGDTGNDCVGTAVRMGAKSVKMIEITKEPSDVNTLPWPNYPNKKKTDYGVLEANTLYGSDIRIYESTITGIVGDKSIECVTISKVDDKFNVIKGTEETVPCDALLISMGFLGTKEEDLKAYGLDHNGFKVKLDNFKYDDKITVCGDMKNGQSLVVSAIKDGLDAASYIIDKFSK